MILISKVRMSVLKKINLMALIRTLTISTTTTFERMKEKFDGFRQTEIVSMTERKPLRCLVVKVFLAQEILPTDLNPLILVCLNSTGNSNFSSEF